MKKVVLFFVFLIGIVSGGTSVFASDIPFKVIPIPSETQNIKNVSYFDIKVQPGNTVTQTFLIENRTNQQISVAVEPAVAISGTNGLISYISEKELKELPEGDFNLHENINVPEKIDLKGKETKKVSFYINTPKNDSGIYLSGLNFSEKMKQSTVNDTENGLNFIIDNELQYTAAVQLNMPKQEKNEYSLGDKLRIHRDSRIEVFLPVKNENRTIIKEEFKYEVSKVEGKKEILVSESKFPFTMAPKTSVEYLVPWEGILQEGDYVLRVYDEKGGFIKEYRFTISPREVEKIVNDEDENRVIINKEIPFWLISIVILFGILIIALIIVILRLRKKNNESDENGG